MKKSFLIALFILIVPGALHAGRLKCTLPDDAREVLLLSAGTQPFLEHIRSRSQARIDELRAQYRVDALEKGVKDAQNTAAKTGQAYADKVNDLRESYLSKIHVTFHSVESCVNSHSALGDVMFYYTAKNNSDMIVTDITYKPLIDGKALPATTSLVLEFINPQNLISGLGPSETLGNSGHDPEKFSFFTGEISPEGLKGLKKDFPGKFGIKIIDMHFAARKGYKGQIRVLTFEEAFADRLKAGETASSRAAAEAKEKKESCAKALKEFTSQQEGALALEKKSLEELKKSSIRATATRDRKNRYVFDGVPQGTYFLYAGNGKGKAVFEKIVIDKGKQQATYTRMGKDPFVP